ncbi:MAG TPA: FUSC family protein [Microbacteriaceae bacterium]|nr:FUSC family protein [Microbacteriaceae bacterium]
MPGRHATWVWASDVGLGRLRSASQAVLTMMVGMASEWFFIRLTHALQFPVPAGGPSAAAARVAFFDHATLLIGLMLGIMIGMMSGFTGPGVSGWRKALTDFGWMPIPLTAGLALGSVLGDWHTATLIVLVFVFAAGTYARRAGPHGFQGGILGFIGYFLGFFLREHAGIGPADLGWLAVEVVVAVAAGLLVQVTVFFPTAARMARRAVRSYVARSWRVFAACDRILGAGGARPDASYTLMRRVDLAGEAALIVDFHLAGLHHDVPGLPAGDLGRRLLLGHEQAVRRFASALCQGGAWPERDQLLTRLLRSGVRAAARGDLRRLDRVLATLQAYETRRAPAVESLGQVSAAAHAWRDAADRPRSLEQVSASPVVLFAGWLPGATLVSRAASVTPGEGSATVLSPHVRAAVQMAVAGAAAIVAGSLLSGYRFYWAALGAFFILVGTNHAGEQVRKAVYRVAGTLVGAIIAVPVAHLAGSRPAPVIAVVLVSLFVGLYLMRVNYSLMIVGITVAVAELYVEFHEFTDGLLLLRLGETALGAAVTAAAVVLILPLRQGRVVTVAATRYQEAVRAMSTGPANVDAARKADTAYQELMSVAAPRHAPYGPLVRTRNAGRRRLLRRLGDAHRVRLPAPPSGGSTRPRQ